MYVSVHIACVKDILLLSLLYASQSINGFLVSHLANERSKREGEKERETQRERETNLQWFVNGLINVYYIKVTWCYIPGAPI